MAGTITCAEAELLIAQGFAVQRPPLHVPGGRTVVAHSSVEHHLVHMQVGLPVAVVVLGKGVGAPQRALDVRPAVTLSILSAPSMPRSSSR
jgi:hypothetical protein